MSNTNPTEHQLILTIPLMPFELLAPKDLNYYAFQSFHYGRTWWYLYLYLVMFIFQKRVVCTILDIYVFVIFRPLYCLYISVFDLRLLISTYIIIKLFLLKCIVYNEMSLLIYLFSRFFWYAYKRWHISSRQTCQ